MGGWSFCRLRWRVDPDKPSRTGGGAGVFSERTTDPPLILGSWSACRLQRREDPESLSRNGGGDGVFSERTTDPPFTSAEVSRRECWLIHSLILSILAGHGVSPGWATRPPELSSATAAPQERLAEVPAGQSGEAHNPPMVREVLAAPRTPASGSRGPELAVEASLSCS